MSKNNPLANLRKAHQAQSIANDSHTLQNWVAQNGETPMMLKAIEVKYLPQYDASNPQAKAGVSGNGYRTRFITADGESIGTFSGAAYTFFQFIAGIMGIDQSAAYQHIDVNGVIPVKVSKVQLDGGKSTYNFEILEEGGELNGFEQYVPTINNIMALPEGQTDTEE